MRDRILWLFRSSRFWPAVLTVMFLLVGCGSAPSSLTAQKAAITPILSAIQPISISSTTTYLGMVSGTQALLGIVLDGVQVRAYTCDGTPSRLATFAEWFAGSMRNGRVQTSSQDQALLTIQFNRESASGTLILATGQTYSFSIPLVVASAHTGVFEGTALIGQQRFHAGWLLLPSGEERGAARYYPSGPVRGRAIIALLPAFPSGPVRG